MVRWRQALRVLIGIALLAGLAVVREEAGAAEKMYWVDDGSGAIKDKIQRANLNGTGVEVLAQFLVGDPGPKAIALDVGAGKMYWTDTNFNNIQRANLDGTGVEVLVSGLAEPLYLALDVAGGKMYWTDDGTRKIQRANLDGTGVQDLVTGLGDPRGIALDLTCPSSFDFDFSGTQYTDCFRDVLRGGEIDAGPDVGGTGHDSLVFTGLTGSAGATWLTVYDATPTTPAPGDTFAAETLCADVLFARFNNIKGAGMVTLLNEGVDKRGLALIVSDAGNTDLLRLATVEGDPAKQGKLKVLTTVPLKNGIAENVWYRLIMTVDPAVPRVRGKVFTHSLPHDPDSALGVQVGPTLKYDAALPAGVATTGQNGLLAQAVSAVVDLSVTNFTNDPALCATPPVACDPAVPDSCEVSDGEPVTALAGATGSQQHFFIDVPAGMPSLTVKTSGGTGDVDLYVKFGAAPTTSSYNCRPYLNGNAETCTIPNPSAGRWYIMLMGYASYSGVTLEASY